MVCCVCCVVLTRLTDGFARRDPSARNSKWKESHLLELRHAAVSREHSLAVASVSSALTHLYIHDSDLRHTQLVLPDLLRSNRTIIDLDLAHNNLNNDGMELHLACAQGGACPYNSML